MTCLDVVGISEVNWITCCWHDQVWKDTSKHVEEIELKRTRENKIESTIFSSAALVKSEHHFKYFVHNPSPSWIYVGFFNWMYSIRKKQISSSLSFPNVHKTMCRLTMNVLQVGFRAYTNCEHVYKTSSITSTLNACFAASSLAADFVPPTPVPKIWPLTCHFFR